MPLKIHPNFPRYRQHDSQVAVWNVTPSFRGCYHRFFDTTPTSPSGRYVAALRMPDEQRLNQPGDVADVVLMDLHAGTEKVVARTRGWESQMGANINWGQDDHTLVFNDVQDNTRHLYLADMSPMI